MQAHASQALHSSHTVSRTYLTSLYASTYNDTSNVGREAFFFMALMNNGIACVVVCAVLGAAMSTQLCYTST